MVHGRAMNDNERIEALLDLVDPGRAGNKTRGPELAVLGLAEDVRKVGYRPTVAGWMLLGSQGRAFQNW